MHCRPPPITRLVFPASLSCRGQQNWTRTKATRKKKWFGQGKWSTDPPTDRRPKWSRPPLLPIQYVPIQATTRDDLGAPFPPLLPSTTQGCWVGPPRAVSGPENGGRISYFFSPLTKAIHDASARSGKSPSLPIKSGLQRWSSDGIFNRGPKKSQVILQWKNRQSVKTMPPKSTVEKFLFHWFLKNMNQFVVCKCIPCIFAHTFAFTTSAKKQEFSRAKNTQAKFWAN